MIVLMMELFVKIYKKRRLRLLRSAHISKLGSNIGACSLFDWIYWFIYFFLFCLRLTMGEINNKTTW